MPRWRPLAEGMDPQLQEFVSQLRRLVDRSGMSVAAVADRTGYSKSSWERYLDGRLLPPRGATHALAEATGTDVRHLSTMWELAERSWSRSEMRHDETMEAVRVAQARAALGEFADEPARKRGRRPEPRRNDAPAPVRDDGTVALRSPKAPVPQRSERSSGRRRAAVLVACAAGALAVMAAAVLSFDLIGTDDSRAQAPPAPTAGTPKLPGGVKCRGEDCQGKDPETMGCGGRHAESSGSAWAGRSMVEVRYSRICGASWARITGAAQGDSIRIEATGRPQSDEVTASGDAYTKMVAVDSPSMARACALPPSGPETCTPEG